MPGCPFFMRPRTLMAVRGPLREELFSAEALENLEGFSDVTYHKSDTDMEPAELLDSIGGHQALVTSWGSPRVTEEVLQRAGDLEIICHSAGSVRQYIIEGVFERGIRVTNASSAIALSVAETTLGLMICSLRFLCAYDRHLRQGGQGRPDYDPMHELSGRTVGIVGMGEVGRRVIELLEPFSCRVLVYDPHRPEKAVRALGATAASLEGVMSGSDVVSIHAPDIPQNRGMIDADLLRKLPDGALFVNTARSRLVDEDALLRELNSGRIRCALDVYDFDIDDVSGSDCIKRNLMLTPHIAGKSVEGRKRQGDTVVEDLRLFFKGQEPLNPVTEDMMEWIA